MENPTILKYVTNSLSDARGKWPEIAQATGVPYHTISKISSGAIHDPGVRKIEKLAEYFRLKDQAA